MVNTERQLVYQLVHIIDFIVLICCLVIEGMAQISTILLACEPALLTEALPARRVTSH